MFQETETTNKLLTLSPKKYFLIFQEKEAPKKFLIFQETEISYISGNGTLRAQKMKNSRSEKTSYISGNRTF